MTVYYVEKSLEKPFAEILQTDECFNYLTVTRIAPLSVSEKESPQNSERKILELPFSEKDILEICGENFSLFDDYRDQLIGIYISILFPDVRGSYCYYRKKRNSTFLGSLDPCKKPGLTLADTIREHSGRMHPQLLPRTVASFSDSGGVFYDSAKVRKFFSSIEDFHAMPFWNVFFCSLDPIFDSCLSADIHDVYCAFCELLQSKVIDNSGNEGANFVQPRFHNIQPSRPDIKLRAINSRKIIHIHIPKAAGRSVWRALFPEPAGIKNEWAGAVCPPMHATAHDWLRLVGSAVYHSSFSFAFIRNPYDRIVAEYLFSRSIKHEVFYDEYDQHTRELSFPEWVQVQFLRGHRPLRSQVEYLHDKGGNQMVTWIGRFESIYEDWEVIKHMLGVNERLNLGNINEEREDFRNYYTPESAEIVTQWFKDDLLRFNYSFDC